MSIGSNILKKTINEARGNQESICKMAKVTSIADGNIYITFFGEEEQSSKRYKKLSTYNANVGDVVLLLRVNKSYIIAGRVE